VQLDNASGNKSKLFLAFIAYLTEKKFCRNQNQLFDTHEDVDSYFSLISRYFKWMLLGVLIVPDFKGKMSVKNLCSLKKGI
jgi:hypothetical protein